MSNSAKTSPSNSPEVRSEQPRAIVHKQILNVAEDRPGASTTEIAAQVSGASIGLVERVLEEYGDPAPTQSAAEATAGGAERDAIESAEVDDDEARQMPELADLTTKQRRTLGEIFERPQATQGDLADTFGVERTSINHRLNNIEGFEWERRHEFVRELFADAEGSGDSNDDGPTVQGDATDPLAWGEAAADRATPGGRPVTGDDEACTHAIKLDLPLARKVLHACLESDELTADEELRLVRGYLASTTSES